MAGGAIMTLAIIADVHGNIAALDAVLADAERLGVDEYVFAGDYINDMPFSNAVTRRLRALEDAGRATVAAGNKEARLPARMADDQSGWVYDQMGALYQTFRELTPSNLDWLARLPERRTVSLPGARTLLIEHVFQPLYTTRADGSKIKTIYNSSAFFMAEYTRRPFSHAAFLARVALELSADCAPAIAATPAEIIVSGHTHFQWHAFVGDTLLINPGGCGQPLDGDPRAPYTVLRVTDAGIEIDERRVAYDIEGAIAAAKDTEVYRRGTIWLDACFASMRRGRDYVDPLRDAARRIAAELGTPTPVREPVSNAAWRLAGAELYATLAREAEKRQQG
jgi:predicted phosphodiesterase